MCLAQYSPQKCGNGLHNHPFGLCTGPRCGGISWTAFSTSHTHADTHYSPVPQPAVFTGSLLFAKALTCSQDLLSSRSSITNGLRWVTSSTSGICATPSLPWLRGDVFMSCIWTYKEQHVWGRMLNANAFPSISAGTGGTEAEASPGTTQHMVEVIAHIRPSPPPSINFQSGNF